MAQRVTLRKRNPYNTTSNRRRVVKTPGGKLVYHHIKKLATAPKCGDCGIALPGVCLLRLVCVDRYRRLIVRVCRLLHSGLASTPLSQRRRRLCVGHTVVRDAATASSSGTSVSLLRLTSYSYILPSILRAFLVEEAKIVKKVIKSQEKASRK